MTNGAISLVGGGSYFFFSFSFSFSSSCAYRSEPVRAGFAGSDCFSLWFEILRLHSYSRFLVFFFFTYKSCQLIPFHHTYSYSQAKNKKHRQTNDNLIMVIRAATYKKLTNSLFSTTFLVAVGVVSLSSVIECPANQVSNEHSEESSMTRQREMFLRQQQQQHQQQQ